MDNFVGIKELYDVSIRTIAPLKVGSKIYQPNESILSLSTVEIGQLDEKKSRIPVRGGFHNEYLMDWEIDTEVGFGITHGVLSPNSWALLTNSQIQKPKYKSISYLETVDVIEDSEYCFFDLKYCPNFINEQLGAQGNPNFEPLPMGRRQELPLKPLPPSQSKWFFCYNLETGQLINDYQIIDNRVYIRQNCRKVMVDYTFTYEDKIQVLEVGNRLLDNFLKLTGKTSVKDEKSGAVTTGILELPKIKISSTLSIRLGKNYDSSIVSDFYFTAYPPDMKKGTVAKLTFLDKELTGEYT